MRELSRLIDDFNRFAVGFDPTFSLLDRVSMQNTSNYPPYDLEKINDSNYRITIAVAGFLEHDLEITLSNNVLTVKGEIIKVPETTVFLHKGIGGRSFTRTFILDKNVQVTGSKLENGLLMIDLTHQIPDHMMPKKIEIKSSSSALDSSKDKK